jgi:glycosyltransferase involved in cell wall biosynthesis
MKNKSIGIIISTYNNPAWLEKVLWGYCWQTRKADEIIVADDGSGPETSALLKSFKPKLPINHIWQEDNGFQKSRILNKALVAAESDYLIFTDQDCIPRSDFIAAHERFARQGYFLSGGYFKLPMDISRLINENDIITQNAFRFKWLRDHNLPFSLKCSKLIQNKFFVSLMNFITPTKATWNGCNSSGWREDMLKINGFNEEMQYHGQDREFGERLFNLSIKSIQIRYLAILLHLDHKRPYRTQESINKNKAIRKKTRNLGIIETPNGIKQQKHVA